MMGWYEIGIKSVAALNNCTTTICSPEAPRGPARSGASVIIYGVTGIPRSTPATEVLRRWRATAYSLTLDEWAAVGWSVPWPVIAGTPAGHIVRVSDLIYWRADERGRLAEPS